MGKLAQMKRGNISQLLSDYKKLESNAFWNYYLDELEKDRIKEAVNSHTELSQTEEKWRQSQGRCHGFHLAKVKIDDLVLILKEALEDYDERAEANRDTAL